MADAHSIWLFLKMWGRPRMAAWFVFSFAVILISQLFFSPAQMLPYYVGFNPCMFLIPLFAVLFGPAGVLAATGAVMVADLLTGMAAALLPFRAAGIFLWAYSAQLLWSRFSWQKWGDPSELQLGIHFLRAALPGCVLHAVWVGWGCEWLRVYPFPYAATLLLLPNTVYLLLLGCPLFVWLYARCVAKDALWQLQLPEANRLRFRKRSVVLLWVGALGGYIAGDLVAYAVYNIRPLSSFIIGVTDCPWVIVVVSSFVLLQLLAVFGIPVITFARTHE